MIGNSPSVSRRPSRSCARLLLWLGSAPLLLGCAASSVRDLADNDLIYRDTGYHSKLPGDRSVFVAPLADARTPVADAVAIEGGYPLIYDDDARWQRPVVEMVDDVLRREIEESGLFRQVVTAADAADVVLLPQLVAFATAAMECESGGRSLAEVGVRLQAFGPIGADGQRPVLIDQVFGERKLTDVAFRTASRHVLAGAAAMATVQRLLQGLDGKNVGRNGIPTAAATAR